MRCPFLPRAAFCGVALLVTVVVGCQSGGQHDIVVRELRMQEDQLYALENYLAQYQQLVRQYRSENASLRRQLAEVNGAADGILSSPRDGESTGRSSGAGGPTLPKTNGRPQQETPAAPNDTDRAEPEIPPLEPMPPPASSSAASTAFAPASALAAEEAGRAIVTQVRLVEPVPNASAAAGQATSHCYSLHGEILANDTGGGPRLVVDVEAEDSFAASEPSDDTLSIMILERPANAVPHSLARWDFTADEVRDSMTISDGRRLMRFYLELPNDFVSAAVTEIWARIVPQVGEKILVHADLNLQTPGQFSSQRDELNSIGAVRHELANRNEPREAVPVAALQPLDESEWTIARPGEPAVGKLLSEPSEDWRASLAPSLPSKVAEASVVKPPRKVPSAAQLSGVKATPQQYVRPTWSPDRAGGKSTLSGRTARHSTPPAHRPAWSPTR